MKTKNIITVVLLIFTVSFFACNEKENCEPFILIAQRSLGGSEGIPQQNIVVKTQKEWESFKTLMDTGYYQGYSSVKETDSFSETEIDFDMYQIIAAISDRLPDPCWGMKIACIAEHIDKIVVTIQISSLRGRNVVCFDMQHQPYHIVKIPATAKNIEFNTTK